MNKTTLSIAVGLLLTSNTSFAKNNTPSVEQRLQQLEQRLHVAEERATQAENQVLDLKSQQSVAMQEIKDAAGSIPMKTLTSAEETAKNMTPPTLQLSGFGDLKIYGDVEFNMDAESSRGSLIKNHDESHEQWDLNGRILVGFDGQRKLENGYYTGFSAQPTADMYGSMNLDDAIFVFGRENDWKVKMGRFEAYDMFPLGQDTFVEHTGNTANDLYDDGHGYIYMMKEGRGRSDAGGNFLVSKQIDNWYFELNSLLEDGTSLYANDQYHGRELATDKNVIYLRPVIAWSQDNLSMAAAMEKNVIDNAYGYLDSKGQFVDQSERTGYGFTMTWNGLKTDPDNGIVVNFDTAYLDAPNEQDFTTALNAMWKSFQLGYVYAHNEITDFDGYICDDDCWIKNEGSYDIHTIHTSYMIPNLMNVDNFDIYLGAYWSKMESDNGSNDDRYGARVRFKYYF